MAITDKLVLNILNRPVTELDIILDYRNIVYV